MKKLSLGAATGIGVGVGVAVSVALDDYAVGFGIGVAIVIVMKFYSIKPILLSHIMLQDRGFMDRSNKIFFNC